ncbi:hypothetical protein OJ967_25385 [Peribacillus frigoritolerans]|uniref:hypothetical protein n=1 Tax=Peribacillus frigoritolerans TaxID=450367 RepID=UPI0022268781|nr:hypothetical protein [Peribacillus frigoritolerans]UYY98646.1 hypothetical protein OJ967_25385 [Peribacillus frigoritolerans]
MNGLITTIIAATAGLVAIIGGFLVSRVIAIASEQNGIKRRIKEIKNDKLAKVEMLFSAENFLFKDDLNDFVSKENIKRIILGRTLEEVIEEDEYTYLSKDQLEPYYEQLKEMYAELMELHGSTKAYYEKFSEFKKVFTDYKYPDHMEWYERIFEVIDDMAQPEAQGPFSHMKFKAIPHTLTPNTDYKDTKKERDRLNDELRILDLQLEDIMKIYNDYGKPKWVWSGLMVLVYACIVGIVYPSTLLPYPKNVYDDVLTKWFLLGLFFSQLLFLIIYLGIAMYQLTHPKED